MPLQGKHIEGFGLKVRRRGVVCHFLVSEAAGRPPPQLRWRLQRSPRIASAGPRPLGRALAAAQVEGHQGSKDDTSVNGVFAVCTDRPGSNVYPDRLYPRAGPYGSDRPYQMCPPGWGEGCISPGPRQACRLRACAPAAAAAGAGPHSARANLTACSQGGRLVCRRPAAHSPALTSAAALPAGVDALWVRIEPPLGSKGDDTALNNIRQAASRAHCLTAA